MPLVSLEFNEPIIEKPREKCDLPALKSPLFLSLFVSPSFSFSPNRLGEDSGQVGCHLTCHMSISYWLIGFPPYPLILNSGFLSTHEMPHVHMGPTWLSLFDLLKTRQVAQCEPLNTYHVSSDTLRLEKLAILTVSESNEIRRGS